MPNGNTRPYVLKEACSKKLQVCLGTYDLLLPPDTKVLKV